MTPVLDTARLVLRPYSMEDAAPLQAVFPQWEIVKYLANVVPWPYPADGAFCYLRDMALPAMERGDEWHWTLRLKGDERRVIGAIGLMKGEAFNRGFWIAPEFQGRGLMTEACEAVTAFWFEVLGMPVLRAPKAVANVGSRRISEKSGMRVVRVEEREYVSGRLLSEIWEITAAEWRVRRVKPEPLRLRRDRG